MKLCQMCSQASNLLSTPIWQAHLVREMSGNIVLLMEQRGRSGEEQRGGRIDGERVSGDIGGEGGALGRRTGMEKGGKGETMQAER